MADVIRRGTGVRALVLGREDCQRQDRHDQRSPRHLVQRLQPEPRGHGVGGLRPGALAGRGRGRQRAPRCRSGCSFMREALRGVPDRAAPAARRAGALRACRRAPACWRRRAIRTRIWRVLPGDQLPAEPAARAAVPGTAGARAARHRQPIAGRVDLLRMPRRNSPRNDNLRRALAQEAARIMAEHGIQDFLRRQAQGRRALRRRRGGRAAAQHRDRGRAGRVPAAVRRRRPRRNAGARSAARRCRRCSSLADFEPRLVGPVLTGTATAHAPCSCTCSPTVPRAVALSLLDRGIAHEVASGACASTPSASQALSRRCASSSASRRFEATVFPVDGIRQAPVSPVDGRPMRRADVAEVEVLLDGTA